MTRLETLQRYLALALDRCGKSHFVSVSFNSGPGPTITIQGIRERRFSMLPRSGRSSE